ncbi:inositol transporter 4 [Rhododendron vialii]|uniref:inositol transporter 4 n=1 Tax=Rhododendron vialii TaxID=182163 RepID=UPI00265D92BF|nr:inositol transporter 4 [Rhododendron vialii]XP_058196879.1 inositol transporter 4 [Rhododendron vialii]
MEGVGRVDKTEFTECWRTSWKTPYIMRLAFSAGLGGLLFGYDTGVISGALLYIRDDFKSVDRKTWLQETIVSMAVAGAIVGAAIGGWMNDKFGRKKSILVADFLFFIGAIVMAVAPAPWVIIIGRIFVGLGVGMASMTSPLYISEASPARIRGALVSTNGLLITGGQFLSYLINLAFTRVPGTWRWMLGVAGIPALFQFILMLSLPESPRWLYRKNKVDEARAILENIYPAEEVEEEMKALQSSVEAEKAEEDSIGDDIISKVKGAWSNDVVRRGLYAGITVQVAQQFVGINTVMYYSPTIVQLAGFASNKTALALSLVTSGLNALGSIVSMVTVDRYGRRKLMIISMIGIIVCLLALTVVFHESSTHSPSISRFESGHFGGNSTCSSYLTASDASSWNCMTCLKASSECGYCATSPNKYLPGACLKVNDATKGVCGAEHRVWYTKGCPSKIGGLAVALLGLYIILYSPGMGTVPWIVNSEIYPLRYRGIGGGIAAVSNWTSNLLVSETFLTLTEAIGSAGTFMLFAGFSFLGLIAIYFLVPETKGLPFEEVEKMLEKGYRPSICSKEKDAKKMDVNPSIS